LPGAGPDLDVEGPRELLEVHPADDLADGLGAHARVEQAAAASARAVALLEAAQLELAERLHRLQRLDLLADLAKLVLGALGLARELLALAAKRVVDARDEVGDLLIDRPLLVLLALLQLGVDPLGLGRDDLPERRGGLLAALRAGRDDDLARRGEDDRVGGLAGLQLGELGLDGLGRGDDLLGPDRSLLLEVGLRRREGGGQLVLGLVDVGPEAVLQLGQLLAGLAAATLGLVLERLERSLARVLVDVRDDVEGEVEDALEVPRADVEEDAEAARRALEVPDVADRARQLDVAHPLATDLAARDLDAALVADDALVANPLVLPAVALPVLGRTEDALVEQTVLLWLEGPVVDRLGLRDLTLRPFPDLVRAGE